MRVRSQRLVSLAHRHLAMLTFEVTVLDGAAPVVISSQLLNRQDGEDEYHVAAAALGHGRDPRQMRKFDHRVLIPRLHREIRRRGRPRLPVCQQRDDAGLRVPPPRRVVDVGQGRDDGRPRPRQDRLHRPRRAGPDDPHRQAGDLPHVDGACPPRSSPIAAAARSIGPSTTGRRPLLSEQREWLAGFWESSDVELRGDDAAQQALRWNLFELAQASAQTQEHGIGAKGLTGGGYEGHYFWDTEIYIVPFLAYTSPDTARKLLRFRWHMLPAARRRAAEVNQIGALYPWRTINGEEASAYYAAGTAQYHINAAVAFALKRYLDASGDVELRRRRGVRDARRDRPPVGGPRASTRPTTTSRRSASTA